MARRRLNQNVLEAARARVSWVFDHFPRIYLSGPSGKDSGAMMHLVCLEARARGRKVAVLYVDLEAQYRVTIENVREMFDLYSDVIDPYWVALPLRLRSATMPALLMTPKISTSVIGPTSRSMTSNAAWCALLRGAISRVAPMLARPPRSSPRPW